MEETPTQEVNRVIGSLKITIGEAMKLIGEKTRITTKKIKEFAAEIANAERVDKKYKDTPDITADTRKELRDHIAQLKTYNTTLTSGWGEDDVADSEFDPSVVSAIRSSAAAPPISSPPAGIGLRRLPTGDIPAGTKERHRMIASDLSSYDLGATHPRSKLGAPPPRPGAPPPGVPLVPGGPAPPPRPDAPPPLVTAEEVRAITANAQAAINHANTRILEYFVRVNNYFVNVVGNPRVISVPLDEVQPLVDEITRNFITDIDRFIAEATIIRDNILRIASDFEALGVDRSLPAAARAAHAQLDAAIAAVRDARDRLTTTIIPAALAYLAIHAPPPGAPPPVVPPPGDRGRGDRGRGGRGRGDPLPPVVPLVPGGPLPPVVPLPVVPLPGGPPPGGRRRGDRGRGGPGRTQRRGQWDRQEAPRETIRRPQETIDQKIASIADGIESIERLRYADFLQIRDTILRPHNPVGIDAAIAAVRVDGDVPKAINAYVNDGIQNIVQNTEMNDRQQFCSQIKEILKYGLGELDDPNALQNLHSKIGLAITEFKKINLLQKQLPDNITLAIQTAITALPDDQKSLKDAVKLMLDEPSEKNFKLLEIAFLPQLQAARAAAAAAGAAAGAAPPPITPVHQQLIDLARLFNAAKQVSVTPEKISEFKNLSDQFETVANSIEPIQRAIVSTSDVWDYADGYDFYGVIQNLYQKQFETEALIADTTYLLSEKIPARGGAVSKEKMREIATAEKSTKLREDAASKLRDLQLKNEKVTRRITDWNSRLAAGVLTYQGRVDAEKELKSLFKEFEDATKGVYDVQKELESSRTDRWFETLEEKTSNYVEFADALLAARKKRIEAEIKAKETTAKFATANTIKRLIENCLNDLKGVSTKKCDRINSLRELNRTAKEIEAAKSDLISKAQLMIDPSRGTAQFSDELTDGQRIKRFEDLKKVITQESQSFVENNVTVNNNPINNNVMFRTNFNQYAVILKQVADSSAFYGNNLSSKTNEDLAELRRNVEEYEKRKNELLTSPDIIPIDELLHKYFDRSTELAKKILDSQPVLLSLTKGGGELVRQQIDANKRQVDQATEKFMAEYEESKSLPRDIQRSDQAAKNCFNEGFSASKKEKEAALKEELVSIKAGVETQMKKVEEEHTTNVAKLKDEVVKTQELKKELKDLSQEELDKKYGNILNEVEILDRKIKENKPEDAEKIPIFTERVALLRTKLSDIGKLRNPPAVGGRRATRRAIH